MSFYQTPPELRNQYEDDRVLRSYLARVLPKDVEQAIRPELIEMGALAAGPLYQLHLEHRKAEPTLTQWDPWGHRVDHIEVTPVWREAGRVAAQRGLVATAYERRHGEHSRVHQLALMYLFDPSTDIFTCPLGAADGAAKALIASGNQDLIERALPRLTSRDPATAWTSGQWMTERTGGSDVGSAETVARLEDGAWRLYGTKWFASTTTSQMSLALARPEGNGPGGKGLALFYVELRDAQGRMNGVRVNRLKEKLGSRHLPTAELTLEGTRAEPVCGLSGGVRAITPMLNVTRIWNAIGAVARMRRAIALARDYAGKRRAFGALLSDKPLHQSALAELQSVFEARFHLVFRLAELLGGEEAGVLEAEEAALLRLLTPIAKLTATHEGVGVASEALECFGGAGYIEDTGLPMMLRDAQLLPIWEGTTNVLALDALRVIGSDPGALHALEAEAEALISTVRDSRLEAPARRVREALLGARTWLASAVEQGRATVEAGARAFAFALADAMALALLIRHAQWALENEHDLRPLAAANRFALRPMERLLRVEALPEWSRTALALDQAPPQNA